MLLRKTSLSVLFFNALIFGAISASAQSPAMSVGHQSLSISYEDCLARGKQALDLEGYGTSRGGGNFYWGMKGIHSAVVVCDGAPDNRMDVHVWVSSISNDGTVPGAERVRIQQRIERPTTDGVGGGGGGTPVDWTKQADPWRGQNGQRFTLNFYKKKTYFRLHQKLLKSQSLESLSENLCPIFSTCIVAPVRISSNIQP